MLIGKAIGTHDILANPLICFAIAVMCAFVPVSVTVICATVLALIHLFGMSMELAAIATIVVLIVYLLYFRFAPKTGILLILTPLLFYIKIPYIIPVIAALTVGMTGIVPVVCGIFMYYMINFASRYSTAISSMDADSAVQNITFILIIYLITKNLLLQLYHFQ